MTIVKKRAPLAIFTTCFGLFGWSSAAESLDRAVLPIDDHIFERLNGALAGRLDLIGDATSLTLAKGRRFSGWALCVKDDIPSYDGGGPAEAEPPMSASPLALRSSKRLGPNTIRISPITSLKPRSNQNESYTAEEDCSKEETAGLK